MPWDLVKQAFLTSSQVTLMLPTRATGSEGGLHGCLSNGKAPGPPGIRARRTDVGLLRLKQGRDLCASHIHSSEQGDQEGRLLPVTGALPYF